MGIDCFPHYSVLRWFLLYYESEIDWDELKRSMKCYGRRKMFFWLFSPKRNYKHLRKKWAFLCRWCPVWNCISQQKFVILQLVNLDLLRTCIFLWFSLDLPLHSDVLVFISRAGLYQSNHVIFYDATMNTLEVFQHCLSVYFVYLVSSFIER